MRHLPFQATAPPGALALAFAQGILDIAHSSNAGVRRPHLFRSATEPISGALD